VESNVKAVEQQRKALQKRKNSRTATKSIGKGENNRTAMKKQ
jgi:hypothetical protein